jgi:hypothetical protein
MATIDLGKIKIVWRGTYAGGTAYTVDDAVEHTDSGLTSSFICTTASTGNAPSTGGSVHSSWAYLAKGAAAYVSTLTTQGDILYHTGSAEARLAKGTASQQLAMNSGATAPEWVNASSDMVKLSTYTVSGTPSTFDWDITFDDSTYGSYMIRGILAGDTLASSRYKVRQAGSTMASADYDLIYNYGYRAAGGSGAASWGGNVSRTDMQFVDWNVDINKYENIEMRFNLMENTTLYKILISSASGGRQSGGTNYAMGDHSAYAGFLGNTAAITGFHFFRSAGNFAVPTQLTCYGFKK